MKTTSKFTVFRRWLFTVHKQSLPFPKVQVIHLKQQMDDQRDEVKQQKSAYQKSKEFFDGQFSLF